MKKGDLLIVRGNRLIKSDGNVIKKGEIRRENVAREIANEIINENKK